MRFEMKFTIKNELENRIRIRLKDGKLDYVKDQRLSYAIGKIKGVKEVRVYRRTGGVAIGFDSAVLPKEKLITALEKIMLKKIWVPENEFVDESHISLEEIKERRLTPEAKRRIREKIALETAADILLPLPLQVGYHFFQLITLKSL
jgi:copper chaperone CopZ